ncbi:secretory pathway Sec39 family protein [Aspergillus novofumigatus IBT 16806]|uniref:Secretory pathway Sec39 n=1 Tax=Aspergillus novofumigatus (strain IBT 16806) TaxID=1392255 RepID=A0A2I1CAP5_ASPN1|nr:secretory pathway Sec39 [Aspergillus novofumigatus IBT 16806]PKX94692.1 secretory pathway Sec39 [Aspergillus novofumigatus IBT 16806]
MAISATISGAHAILLATQLCATGHVVHLPLLHAQFPSYLPLERLLRIILTFLPESTEPQAYTSVLQELVSGSTTEPFEGDVDVSAVQDLPEAVARKRVRKLRLLPLRHPDDEDSEPSDLLTQFLIHRSHRIDSETGLQPLILDLLLPFYQRSSTVRTWLISSILPLLRLNYEYYPSQDEMFSLNTLESMDDATAVNVLLSMTSPRKDEMDIARNLRGLVGAWIYGSNRAKRRRLNEAANQSAISLPQDSHRPKTTTGAIWQQVNEWLLSHSLVEHDTAVNAFVHWDGPGDVDLGGCGEENQQATQDELAEMRTRYGQSGLAVVYANPDASSSSLEGSMQIVTRVAQLLNLQNSVFVVRKDSALPSVTFDAGEIPSTSRVTLLQNALLLSSNPLTLPSASSVSFLSALLLSLQVLHELGVTIPCRQAANLCLHSTEDMQLAELRSTVSSIAKQATPGRDWKKVREQLLWLRDWQAKQSEQTLNRPPCHGLFWKVSRNTVETEVLRALLEAKEYQLAVDIYTMSDPAPLDANQVEQAVQDAIFAAYDNASNGNRTRGGMKRAYEILQAFQPHFPTSVTLKQIQALIAATHSLSFYSLTLQHGVPFQPVSIRVHPDPLSLIEKVLDQNPKSYTKLDDLLSIGRNLVEAGLPTGATEDHESHFGASPSTSREDAVVTAERRVMSLAISSALSSNDFGTAYSYILTRLTPPSLLPTASQLTNPNVKDDISWRAPSLQAQITRLSQRMELLSLALTLVPYPDPLPEILGAWRRCDEEMNVLRAQESAEEEIWDAKGDSLSTLPGGFGPTDTEQDAFDTKQQHARRVRAQRNRSHLGDAPMGLFEVARGAALALQKNAFPLRSAASAAASPDEITPSARAREAHEESSPQSQEGRVRKRDVVSNMVTGGLASGIGWVLGAQPANRS